MPRPRYDFPEVRFALSKEHLKTSGTPTLRATSRIFSAWRSTDSRLSITHGPAINVKGRPPPIVRSPTLIPVSFDDTKLLQERRLPRFDSMRERRSHEAAEDRMAIERARLELRVELAGEEPRVIRQLDDLDEVAVGGDAGKHQPLLLEQRAEVVVELVTVAMPLGDLLLRVELLRERAVAEHAGISAEPHRGAFLREPLLADHQIDHGMRRLRVNLRGVRAGQAAHVASELDHRHLHA